KVVVIGVLVAFGLGTAGGVAPPAGPAMAGFAWPALGLALVASLWTYDGWYALTFAAGEMRDPARDLPRGLVGGVAAVTVLYLLLNVAYLRALPVQVLASSPRAAEAAAAVFLG